MHVRQRLTPMAILIIFIVRGYRCLHFKFDVYECFSNRIKYSELWRKKNNSSSYAFTRDITGNKADQPAEWDFYILTMH